MVIKTEQFGEEISEFISRGSLFDYDGLGFDEIMKVMMTEIDVLHLSMVFSSLRKSNCSSTVPSDYPSIS